MSVEQSTKWRAKKISFNIDLIISIVRNNRRGVLDHQRRVDVLNNTKVPYVVKKKNYVLEKDNTIVVKHEGFLQRIKKKLFDK